MEKAIHAVVVGRVQGVGFRYSALHRALQLGLAGWIRNLPAGTVEVWAQGDAGRVEEFRSFLAIGPGGATVTRVDILEVDPEPSLQGFQVRG